MNENKTSWIPLILVAFASFIIALDATFMNVSISQLVIDLNTDVGTVQTIISFYTLITASLMLISSKMQDISGKKKIFLIGALTYGTGALIASLSQNALMLFFGWSLLEGIGGALMTPATISIISGTYDGEMRTTALAICSAIIGIAAAIGPLFGGVVTTFLSWRYGFVFELLIIAVIFVFRNKIPTFESTASMKDLDKTGSILSILGLILFVLGILSLSKNFTLSIGLIVVSIFVLIGFGKFEIKRKKKGKIPLFDITLLKDRNLSVGTVIRLITAITIAGSLFSVSIYLQTVLGLSAFMTGLVLLPFTIGLLLFAVIAPKLAIKLNHKIIMLIGFAIAIAGCLLLSHQFTLTTRFTDILPGMLISGAGLGFPMALGIDITISNIPSESQNSSSGFVTTGQSLGMSMGTAIIGAILIIGAVGGMHDAINTYAPNKVSDQQFHDNIHVYFEKLGHVNTTELKGETSLKEKIVSKIIQDAMALIMQVTALLLAIGGVLTLTLEDRKIKG
ncbi:MAG: MFS transporter [Methanobrevibacter sp.]|nr:MFS transporter [Methanobrevibacter sp.]